MFLSDAVAFNTVGEKRMPGDYLHGGDPWHGITVIPTTSTETTPDYTEKGYKKLPLNLHDGGMFKIFDIWHGSSTHFSGATCGIFGNFGVKKLLKQKWEHVQCHMSCPNLRWQPA